MTLFSQNGWSVVTDEADKCHGNIPGTTVQLIVRNDEAGFLLLDFAYRYNRWIEKIAVGRDDYGWVPVRLVRGGTDITNHASATAIDLNALKHPLGKPNTFKGKVIWHGKRTYVTIVLIALLARYRGAIRGGFQYRNRKDDMHWEINQGFAAVVKTAHRVMRTRSGKLIIADNPGLIRRFEKR